jgi:predicted nuclease of predicted toxin-antitoxin system
MNILLDMNISPEWMPFFDQAGHHYLHWTNVGALMAEDREIFTWASENN